MAAQLVRVLRAEGGQKSAKKTLVDPFRALRYVPPEAREAWVEKHADPAVPAGREGARWVTCGSNAYAVWRCTRGEGGCGGHEWVARISSRVNADGTAGSGCPACAGLEVTEANCLETKSPKVAAQLVRVLRAEGGRKSATKTLVDPFRALRGETPEVREAWMEKHADPAVPAGREGARWVIRGSNAYAVWRCTSGEGGCGGHEWVARISSRVNADGTAGSGCPACSGYKLTEANCLATKCPKVAAQLVRVLRAKGKREAGTKTLADRFRALAREAREAWMEEHADPDVPAGPEGARRVTCGSSKYAVWRCTSGEGGCGGHEWVVTINNRVNSDGTAKNGCPACSGYKPTEANCLATKCPKVAAQLVRVLRLRAEGGRAAGTKTLVEPFRALARETREAREAWVEEHADPDVRAGPEGARRVKCGSSKYAVWRCTSGEGGCGGHEWVAQICSRVNADGTLGSGCPACSGLEVTEANCIETKCPEVAAQLVRVLRAEDGRGTATKSLAGQFRALRGETPEVREAWMEKHADPAVPAGREGARWVKYGSGAYAVWRCTSGEGGCGGHEWVARIGHRVKADGTLGSGCPACGLRGWSPASVRNLLLSLAEAIDGDVTDVPESVLYFVFKQSGAIDSAAGLRALRKLTSYGRDDVMRFIKEGDTAGTAIGRDLTRTAALAREPVGGDGTAPLEDAHQDNAAPAVSESFEGSNGAAGETDMTAIDPDAAAPIEAEDARDGAMSLSVDQILNLPAASKVAMRIRPNRELHNAAITGGPGDDADALDFIVSASVSMLWHRALRDDKKRGSDRDTLETVREVKMKVESFNARTDADKYEYQKTVAERFLREYDSAKEMQLPDGYNFTVNGVYTKPTLMQKRCVAALREQGRRGLGNWSDPGTGKHSQGYSRVVHSGRRLRLLQSLLLSRWSYAQTRWRSSGEA